ncbi:DUF3408 domain-containing protein [Prevotella amnii]|uniref:DUF3408 domain-containing protein n=1 Tax=Prevotella amnii DNF00058 TaxID=1401066 RepID=A0A096ART7_9BACT|nr:DUF3408 domain-containing protein [Prevotella amnii]KGF49470.1 hypothetical protein HMPREF9302_10830 [Prevotella amnii DNF00058]
MEKQKVSNEGMKNTIHSDKQYFGLNQIENSSEHIIAELRARKVRLIQEPNEQDTENTMHSEPARNAENVIVQKRISAKMRKKTLEAYKQSYLVPTKLNNRKAVYLSREIQERADFIVRRLGDRGSNISSFVENIVRIHLEEYGEDIEKWRKL